MNFDLALRRGEDGKLQVSVFNEQVHSRGYEINLTGQNDISAAVQNMLESFKVFFEEELISILAHRVMTITESMLLEKLMPEDKSSLRT